MITAPLLSMLVIPVAYSLMLKRRSVLFERARTTARPEG